MGSPRWLQLCLQINAQSVVIELDAKAIVDAFNSPSSSNSIVSSLMDDCICLATRIPQKRFRHIYREANKCADCLARIGSLLDSDFAVFSSPPVDLVFWRLKPLLCLFIGFELNLCWLFSV